MNAHDDGASAAVPGRLPRPWLLADIGGTNARFGWLAAGSVAAEHVETLPTADYAEPGDAVEAYLARLSSALGNAYQAPRAAALAVATAVDADLICFTNSHWRFARAGLQQRLGLDALLVLNDFEALALSLPRLAAHQVQTIGPRRQAPLATLAVIGPGTGLGVAGLLPTRCGWVAVAGEGGHAGLAAGDDFDAALVAAARRSVADVSAERLLSGTGLPLLHSAVAQVLGVAAPTLTAPEIVERALAGGDAVCERCIDSFCALLGGFASGVALTLGARGGVYIGGGIAPRLGERFLQSRFRERFDANERRGAYLQAIPTFLITDTLAALSGAALALEQHLV
ncbi:MAG: glucokinase [Rubrivivax sp.]|nr:glucokinase [Rubrivivax sp.]MDP3082173.1 glucokinase [Rubrivivax sp.]